MICDPTEKFCDVLWSRPYGCISLAVCCKALKLARVSAAVLVAFEDIKSKPNSMTVLAFPDHVLAPYAQPSPNLVHLQMTTPFPVTLPTCQLPADKQRHGLHAVNKLLAHRASFSQQLAEYKAWCTSPIQLGFWVSGLAAATSSLWGSCLNSC